MAGLLLSSGVGSRYLSIAAVAAFWLSMEICPHPAGSLLYDILAT